MAMTCQLAFGNDFTLPGSGLIVNQEEYDCTALLTVSGGGIVPAQGKTDFGAWSIRVFNPQFELKFYDSSNMDRPKLLAGSGFVIDESGPVSANLRFAKSKDLPAINHRDILHIYLENNSTPTFYGYVSKLPGPGTDRDYVEIQGSGMLGQLKWKTVVAVYEEMRVFEIVRDIGENHGLANLGDIRYFPFGISEKADFFVTKIDFKGVPIDECMSQLATLAGPDFRFGITPSGVFFFSNSRSSENYVTWRTGIHFSEFTVDYDSSALYNRSLVKHPASIDSSGFLELPIEDEESQKMYGVREKVFSSPSTIDPVDAYRAASVDLARNSSPQPRSSIRGLIYQGEISIPGIVRLYGRDRAYYELRKKRVKYSFGPAGMTADVELGSLEDNLVELVNEMSTVQKRFEILNRTES